MAFWKRGRWYADEEEYRDEIAEYSKPEYYLDWEPEYEREDGEEEDQE